MYGMYTTAITRIGIQSESPWTLIGPIFRPPSASAVPSATPKSTTGKAQMMSRTRAITESVQPR